MIDMRSDTVTKPSEAMRRAVLDAAVGDDKRDGDPTVGELEALVADRLGTDAAMFTPTGTMANQIAATVHTEPGQELLVDRWAHIYTSEYAGPARFSQLQVRTIDAGPTGCPTPEALQEAYDERSQWPGTGLLSLENTHNKRGGVAVAPADIDEAAGLAHDLGVKVHLDGARLANAAVALDEPMRSFTGEVDSVMFDLSKGLGAPVGALLAGDEEFVAAARNHRAAFGGALRQAGVIAAQGLVAMDNVDRLAEDHDNAAAFAAQLDAETDLGVHRPDTNLVLVDTEPAGLDAHAFVDLCADHDVGTAAISDTRVRFCTHLDLDRSDVTDAATRIRRALEERD